MNRNSQNHFAMIPRANIARSRFSMPFNHKLTFDTGKLIPFYVREVLPGDTFNVDTKILCRMTTPIFPVMDNAYLDYYYFFVPNRLTWEHWKEFMGENNSTEQPWVNPVTYSVPTLKTETLWPIVPNTVADYMGIPPGKTGYEVNALPFRAYTKIWNDWFRDQNNQTAAMNSTSDENNYFAMRASYENGKWNWSLSEGTLHQAYLGGQTLPVAKFHDYFTSALPSPQKGEAVPLLNADSLSIIPDGEFTLSFEMGMPSGSTGYTQVTQDNDYQIRWESLSGPIAAENGKYYSGLAVSSELFGALQNINSLRNAFAVQRFMERSARGGSRYIEVLESHFGVTSPDGRLQRSEYLGGRRVRLNMAQVVQTSSTDSVSPQGNTAAYSLTVSQNGDFTKSFVEHGFVIGVLCVRTNHTYQQGVERFWRRRDKFDYYWPEFAHIGEQPIYVEELYHYSDIEIENNDGPPTYERDERNNEIFGYQEAWADYRYMPDRVSGAFRSDYRGGSLDSWTYTDYFASQPTLSDKFIRETDVNVQRTLAVQTEPQFFADIKVENIAVRPMPTYSVPGLIDHM